MQTMSTLANNATMMHRNNTFIRWWK